MKVIKNELKESAITCAETNPAFPLANMLDDYPRNFWEATGKQAEWHIDFGIGYHAYPYYIFSVYKMNMVSFKFSSFDSADQKIGETTISNLPFINKLGVYSDFWRLHSPLWIPLSFIPEDTVRMTVGMSHGTQNLYCGMLRIGSVFDLLQKPVMKTSVKDHSIVKDMVSGSKYVKARRLQRIMSCNFRDMIDPMTLAGNPIFHSYYEILGASPAVWQITETDEYMMNIFACISGVSYDYRRGGRYADVSFTLTEQI